MNIKKTHDTLKTFLIEKVIVNSKKVSCDGGTDFGHPLVYLNIGNDSEVICPYCSKKFIFRRK